MRIICPTCASHYEVELEKIAAQGQLVRCARCREVWLVRSEEEREMWAPEPTVAPPRAPARPAAVEIGASEVIDFQAAKVRLRRRERVSATDRRANSLSVLAVGAVVLSSFLTLYGFRGAIVKQVPQAAAAYAAVGVPVQTDALALREVHSVLVAEGNETVLTLQGKIANLRNEPTPVPGITVVVRSEGQAPLYTWTAAPPKTTLASGETVDFKTRLASPPSDGRDVRVSFTEAAAKGVALLAP